MAPAVLAVPGRVAHGTHTTSPVVLSYACEYASLQMQDLVVGL